jgi:hypothetical protein
VSVVLHGYNSKLLSSFGARAQTLPSQTEPVAARVRCRDGRGYLFGSCGVPQATGMTRSQGRPKKSALWVAAFIEKRGRADRPTGNAGQPDGGGGNEIVSGCNEVFSSKVLVDHRIVSGCVRVGCRHLARAVDRLISKSNHKALSLGKALRG